MTDPYDVLRPGGSVPSAHVAPLALAAIRPLGGEPIVAIAATGAFTLASVTLGATNLFFENVPYPGPAAPVIALAVLVLYILSGIGAYVALCIWMQAVRTRLHEARYDAPPVWKIWAGWVIPIYAWFAPFQVMTALRTRLLWGSGGLVKLWWATFLMSTILDRGYGAGVFEGGTITVMLVLSGVLLVGSYAALVVIIRSTSASLEPRDTAQSV